jgi:IMP dehydrogenase/GMP reductase
MASFIAGKGGIGVLHRMMSIERNVEVGELGHQHQRHCGDQQGDGGFAQQAHRRDRQGVRHCSER